MCSYFTYAGMLISVSASQSTLGQELQAYNIGGPISASAFCQAASKAGTCLELSSCHMLNHAIC